MLALWEYSWDWGQSNWYTLLLANWHRTSSSPAPSPTPSPTNAGSGKGRGRKYESASPEFWDVRERYLRRFVKPIVTKTRAHIPEQPPQELPSLEAPILLQQAMQAAADRAERAANMVELRLASQRLQSIALDISRIQQQNHDRAIALLLLDVF